MMYLSVLLLLGLCYILAGAETALLNVSKVRVKHAAQDGDLRAAKLLSLLEHRDELIHVVNAFNQASRLIAFGLTGLIVTSHIGPWAWLLHFIVSLPLFLIFFELLPKRLYELKPYLSLKRHVGLLRFLFVLSYPLRQILIRIRPRALSRLPEQLENKGYEDLVQTIAKYPQLCDTTLHMMRNYGRLQHLKAEHLMTPLSQLTALPAELNLNQWILVSKQNPQPWHVILGQNGQLLGWIDTHTLPEKALSDQVLRHYVRPLGQVRKNDTAIKCLRRLRKRSEPLNAVINADKQIIGIISRDQLLQSLLEEASSSKTV